MDKPVKTPLSNIKKQSPVLEKVQERLTVHLHSLMGVMLENADEHLFAQAEKSENNDERMKYMDSTRIFRTQKNDIEYHFFNHLQNSLDNPLLAKTDKNTDTLSLVAQDEMEELVALTNMHEKAMNHFGDEVNDLAIRLEHLLHNKNTLFSDDSVSIFDTIRIDPQNVCHIFQQTIENMDLVIDVKLIFYKLFDQEVCSKLQAVYKDLNQLLIENDVLPKIVLKSKKNKTKKKVKVVESEAVENKLDKNIVSPKIDTFNNIKPVNSKQQTPQATSTLVDKIATDSLQAPSQSASNPTASKSAISKSRRQNSDSAQTGKIAVAQAQTRQQQKNNEQLQKAQATNVQTSQANKATSHEIEKKSSGEKSSGKMAKEKNTSKVLKIQTEVKVDAGFVPRSNAVINRLVTDFMHGNITPSGSLDELPYSFVDMPTIENTQGSSGCYPQELLVNSLSAFQKQLSTQEHKTKNLSTQDVKQALLKEISKTNNGIIDKQLSINDERNIDFVGLMFEAIIDDEAVSQIMTCLISNLQVPLMKIALLDNSLFEQEEHPARVTVDKLAEAGKGINQDEDRLYGELESIVNHILEEFDIDQSLFEEAVKELEQIIEKESKLFDETEKEQLKETIQEQARHVVVKLLKETTFEKQIPSKVRPLILKHWSTLMLNRYIRDGADSSRWIESILLLKLLLKFLQPVRLPSDYSQIKNNYHALLDTVNDELYNTNQDKKDINEQMGRLKSYFESLIKQHDKKFDINDKALENKLKKNSKAKPTQTDVDNEKKVLQDRMKNTKQLMANISKIAKVGAWYEIHAKRGGAVRRLKLSLILDDSAKLVFVDRKGIKVLEKNAVDFMNDIKDKSIQMLSDYSTFDHALGSVIKIIAA